MKNAHRKFNRIIDLLEEISNNTRPIPLNEPVLHARMASFEGSDGLTEKQIKKLIDKRMNKKIPKIKRNINSVRLMTENNQDKIFGLMKDSDELFSAMSQLPSIHCSQLATYAAFYQGTIKFLEQLQPIAPEGMDLAELFRSAVHAETEARIDWQEFAGNHKGVAALLEMKETFKKHVMFSDPDNGDDEYLEHLNTASDDSKMYSSGHWPCHFHGDCDDCDCRLCPNYAQCEDRDCGGPLPDCDHGECEKGDKCDQCRCVKADDDDEGDD